MRKLTFHDRFKKLHEKCQNIAARVVTRTRIRDHSKPVLTDLLWLAVEQDYISHGLSTSRREEEAGGRRLDDRSHGHPCRVNNEWSL